VGYALHRQCFMFLPLLSDVRANMSLAYYPSFSLDAARFFHLFIHELIVLKLRVDQYNFLKFLVEQYSRELCGAT
jgi:hypothetical protein